MAGKLALSVSQLNEYVRRLLQQDPLLREIELKGEISNLKLHQTGTLFFTLKDEAASISCVMYAEDAAMLEMEPFDGMRAVVTGSVGLYARGGQYQFYAKRIKAQGIGVLYERYQQLKERLEREGLFDPGRKQRIPGWVDTVGVVSSPTGAVIHDILNVSLRRDAQARILLCPVRVQGPEAADEVVQAIELLDRMDAVSVIVLARGGGSLEDLWTFNEERVVRAVAACKKPIVSAIGHETDFTLSDFAADLRAPTPSAAAECVVPLRDEAFLALDRARQALRAVADDALDRAQAAIEVKRMALGLSHPRHRLGAEASRLAALKTQLERAAEERLARAQTALDARRLELSLLSPYAVLARGYAMVLKDGRPVGSVSCMQRGDDVRIVMRDGSADAQITKTMCE